MKEISALETLQAFCNGYETLKDAAAALGISKQYLSDILTNKRDFDSPRVYARLGIRRVTVKDTAGAR